MTIEVHLHTREDTTRIIYDGVQIHVLADEPDVIRENLMQMRVRDDFGDFVTAQEDPERWMRGLPGAFRTPYAYATIVRDDA